MSRWVHKKRGIRRALSFCLAAVVLASCDHKHVNPPGSASEESESALTGLAPQPANGAAKPAYPKALPVNIPPPANATPPIVPEDSSSTAASSSSSSKENSSTPLLPPSEPSPPPAPTPTSGNPPDESSAMANAAPSTPPMPDPAAQPPPPAASPDNSAMARPDINNPASVATTAPQSAVEDPDAHIKVVVLRTIFGMIVIQLDDIYAPRTCGNFRKLVSDGFYDHTVFHRVIPNFIIQGGDPNSRNGDRSTYGQGGPGYTLSAEIKLRNIQGAVAMARLPDSVNPERDSNGSQFYICVADCPSLDPNYTVFAHVIRGLDVAEKIAEQPRDAHDDPTDRIEMSARLETKDEAMHEIPDGKL